MSTKVKKENVLLTIVVDDEIKIIKMSKKATSKTCRESIRNIILFVCVEQVLRIFMFK
mgnify:CR=1 FL=1